MSVKRVAIIIEIEDEAPKNSPTSGTYRSDTASGDLRYAFTGADETYLIHLNDVDGDKMKASKQDFMLDAAAHELGHVISNIFNVPGGMQDDPRSKGEAHVSCCLAHSLTKEQAERVLTNEKLAWSIGEKIRKEVNQEDKEYSLGTYRKMAEDADKSKPPDIEKMLETLKMIAMIGKLEKMLGKGKAKAKEAQEAA